MEIKFTINGNQEDPAGNPIPYHRVTGKGLWLPAAKRYAAWKDYVKNEFLDQAKNHIIKPDGYLFGYPIIGKPIVLEHNQKAYMHLKIFWHNGAHGDPDNIFKGIADALFKNDKNLYGSFKPGESDGKGRVEIKIKI